MICFERVSKISNGACPSASRTPTHATPCMMAHCKAWLCLRQPYQQWQHTTTAVLRGSSIDGHMHRRPSACAYGVSRPLNRGSTARGRRRRTIVLARPRAAEPIYVAAVVVVSGIEIVRVPARTSARNCVSGVFPTRSIAASFACTQVLLHLHASRTSRGTRPVNTASSEPDTYVC
jgi:hypothetical protein